MQVALWSHGPNSITVTSVVAPHMKKEFIKLNEDGSHIISIITLHALGLGASITL